MRYSLTVLALTACVLAQDCPTGYNRTIQWHDCPTDDAPGLQCAVLTVPLDYTQSSGPSIPVPLVRVLANSTNPNGAQSIIYNPGGPGGSGISQFASGGGTNLQRKYGTQFNFISFDPRGVALSTIFEDGVNNYNCPVIDGFYNGAVQTSDQIELAVGNYTAQAETCAQEPWGSDGKHISTPANARDIVAISQALAGEDGLVRYYGASYGTLLGSTLAAMFPERMQRVVLDGNINPTDYYYGYGDEANSDIDAAVGHFFSECARAGPQLCPLADNNQTGSELQQEFDNFYATTKNNALASGDWSTWEQVTSGWAVLYHPSDWSQYSYTLYNTYRNTSSQTVKRLVADFDPTAASQLESTQESSTTLLQAVTCGDFKGPRVATLQSFAQYRDLYSTRSVYNPESLLSILYACSAYTIVANDQFNASLTNVRTKNPVLFVNGPFDPVTPLISAQNSSSGFVGSAVLSHDGAGHCSGSEPIAALEAAMATYFDNGLIPEQRVYNRTAAQNSFAPFDTLEPANPDPMVNGTNSTSRTSGAALKQVYPRELLRLLREHHSNVQKRQDNSSSSGIPAGCMPAGTVPYTAGGPKMIASTTAMVVAVVAALIL